MAEKKQETEQIVKEQSVPQLVANKLIITLRNGMQDIVNKDDLLSLEANANSKIFLIKTRVNNTEHIVYYPFEGVMKFDIEVEKS